MGYFLVCDDFGELPLPDLPLHLTWHVGVAHFKGFKGKKKKSPSEFYILDQSELMFPHWISSMLQMSNAPFLISKVLKNSPNYNAEFQNKVAFFFRSPDKFFRHS